MWSPVAGFGILLLLCTGCMAIEQEYNKCYQAKICIHNGKEKCGIGKDGTLRRFFDSCDIKEYNCLKDAEFIKTNINKCNELPPIETSDDHPQLRKRKYDKVKRKLVSSH